MDASTSSDRLGANRARWDERVPLHVASDFYDLDGFKAGQEALRDFELSEVGDVTGKSLLHLRCHIGLDTLAWSRHWPTKSCGWTSSTNTTSRSSHASTPSSVATMGTTAFPEGTRRSR